MSNPTLEAAQEMLELISKATMRSGPAELARALQREFSLVRPALQKAKETADLKKTADMIKELQRARSIDPAIRDRLKDVIWALCDSAAKLR
jgi:hypothetical protein